MENQTKILLVEDDAEISRLTKMFLEVEGYQVNVIEDGALALSAIKQQVPDIVILDLMLPNMSGFDICKQAREFYQQPILILTACDDDTSEVSLLKSGADDYLVKPLRAHVLVARIEVLLRRNRKVAKPASNNPIFFNKMTNHVNYNGNTLDLTGSEYEMLELLYDNAGNVTTREQCYQLLRGIDYDFMNRSIDMRISGLRKKLGDDRMPFKVIKTIRSKGYMLIND
jgi:DNA-binding response OmpR family regulator